MAVNGIVNLEALRESLVAKVNAAVTEAGTPLLADWSNF